VKVREKERTDGFIDLGEDMQQENYEEIIPEESNQSFNDNTLNHDELNDDERSVEGHRDMTSLEDKESTLQEEEEGTLGVFGRTLSTPFPRSQPPSPLLPPTRPPPSANPKPTDGSTLINENNLDIDMKSDNNGDEINDDSCMDAQDEDTDDDDDDDAARMLRDQLKASCDLKLEQSRENNDEQNDGNGSLFERRASFLSEKLKTRPKQVKIQSLFDHPSLVQTSYGSDQTQHNASEKETEKRGVIESAGEMLSRCALEKEKFDLAEQDKVCNNFAKVLAMAMDEAGLTMTALFRLSDISGDGFLDFNEIKVLVRKVLHISQGLLSNADLKLIYKAMDDNNNGQVNSGEFESFLKKGKRANSRKTRRRVSTSFHYTPPTPPSLESPKQTQQNKITFQIDQYAKIVYQCICKKIAKDESQEALTLAQAAHKKYSEEQEMSNKSIEFALNAKEKGLKYASGARVAAESAVANRLVAERLFISLKQEAEDKQLKDMAESISEEALLKLWKWKRVAMDFDVFDSQFLAEIGLFDKDRDSIPINIRKLAYIEMVRGPVGRLSKPKLRYPTGNEPNCKTDASWTRSVFVPPLASPAAPKKSNKTKVNPSSSDSGARRSKAIDLHKESDEKCLKAKMTPSLLLGFLFRGQKCCNQGNSHIAVKNANERVLEFQKKNGLTLRDILKQEVANNKLKRTSVASQNDLTHASALLYNHAQAVAEEAGQCVTIFDVLSVPDEYMLKIPCIDRNKLKLKNVRLLLIREIQENHPTIDKNLPPPQKQQSSNKSGGNETEVVISFEGLEYIVRDSIGLPPNVFSDVLLMRLWVTLHDGYQDVKMPGSDYEGAISLMQLRKLVKLSQKKPQEECIKESKRAMEVAAQRIVEYETKKINENLKLVEMDKERQVLRYSQTIGKQIQNEKLKQEKAELMFENNKDVIFAKKVIKTPPYVGGFKGEDEIMSKRNGPLIETDYESTFNTLIIPHAPPPVHTALPQYALTKSLTKDELSILFTNVPSYAVQ